MLHSRALHLYTLAAMALAAPQKENAQMVKLNEAFRCLCVLPQHKLIRVIDGEAQHSLDGICGLCGAWITNECIIVLLDE